MVGKRDGWLRTQSLLSIQRKQFSRQRRSPEASSPECPMRCMSQRLHILHRPRSVTTLHHHNTFPNMPITSIKSRFSFNLSSSQKQQKKPQSSHRATTTPQSAGTAATPASLREIHCPHWQATPFFLFSSFQRWRATRYTYYIRSRTHTFRATS